MFFIASSGRCGTVALCQGLDTYSDHRVAHEPDPLLREAWLKHRWRPYWSSRYRRRLREYADFHRRDERYGESIRTPNLLGGFLRVARSARTLIIVRDPTEYVRSAFRRDVLRKDDQWDRYRLLPGGLAQDLPIAVRIAHHWCTVNAYLLARHRRTTSSRLVLHQPLERVLEGWCRWLGVTIHDRQALTDFLAQRPNRSESTEEPVGLDEVAAICGPLWSEIRTTAERDGTQGPLRGERRKV